MEQIKNIPNYPLYSASSLGYIINNKSKRILKESVLNSGYKQVTLCKDGTAINKLVHRIIAMVFLDNIENKAQVNHINGVKSDNRLENIEWNTRSENQKHSIKIGLRHTRGENNSQKKLTSEIVIFIFNDKRKYKEISEQYNISIPTVSDIKRGYSWTHITGLQNLKK